MSESAGRSLAGKLHRLFASVKTGPAREYSNEHVAAVIRAASVSVSQGYTWQLRKDKMINSALKHLQILTEFFGVPTAQRLAWPLGRGEESAGPPVVVN